MNAANPIKACMMIFCKFLLAEEKFELATVFSVLLLMLWKFIQFTEKKKVCYHQLALENCADKFFSQAFYFKAYKRQHIYYFKFKFQKIYFDQTNMILIKIYFFEI